MMEEKPKEKTADDVMATVADTPSVKARPIFIIENASLSKALVRKRWKILDSEEDADYLLKHEKKLADFRLPFQQKQAPKKPLQEQK